jgi:hypothetical protein
MALDIGKSADGRKSEQNQWRGTEKASNMIRGKPPLPPDLAA